MNTGVTTWYGFAKQIFELTGNMHVKVTPMTTMQFVRPCTATGLFSAGYAVDGDSAESGA